MPTLYDGPEASSLVLIGDQQRSGMSIIPTSTPLTRLNYFDGKFLRADDMRLDQNYGRHLVALSVRGGGFGVVYGFELEPDDAISDRVQLRGGLAVAPSGRVIHLPSTALVSLTELIERSEQPFDPSRPSPADGGDAFAPCEPAPPPAPDVTVTETPIYVITIAPEEALCGEEERFGQLCADACLTETDRPRRVEGIRLRARPLSLTGLPVSTAVAFTSLHFRSRVATAYFAAEQRQLESLISGQGLQSRLWCLGAGAVEGNEVPIAIVARAGGVTTLLDGWTARRELMEQSARRWWTFRFSMRPWDIFLAAGAAVPVPASRAPDSGPDRPGAAAVHRRAPRGSATLSDVVAALDLQAPAGLDPAVAGKLKAVHDKAVEVLTGAGSGTPPSHGGFIARGFVTVPSAGYLPVSLTAELDVPTQVTAMFGPGVDLRFCAARSDVIPHLLEQAQHMERISLFVGLDDPARKEAVDVIVPDAGFSDATTARYPTYFGSLRLFPGSKRDGPDEEGDIDGGDVDGGDIEGRPRAAVVTGAALALRSVARNRSTGQGWTWAMAAYGEAPQGVAVERLFLVLLGIAGITGSETTEPDVPAAPAAAPFEVPLTEDRVLDEHHRRGAVHPRRQPRAGGGRRAPCPPDRVRGGAVGMGWREHRGRSTVAAGRSATGRAVVRRRRLAESDQRRGERPDRLHDAGHRVLRARRRTLCSSTCASTERCASSSAASPSSPAASRSRSCARRSSGFSTRCSWRRGRTTRRRERCRPPWCGASVTPPPAIRSCSASSTAVPASSPPSKRPSRPSVPPARRCGPASASPRRSSRWSRALRPHSGRGRLRRARVSVRPSRLRRCSATTRRSTRARSGATWPRSWSNRSAPS